MHRECQRKHGEWILDVLAILFPLSEIGKQILLTLSHGSYIWWYFPFQLCSLPLYLLPLRQVLVHSRSASARSSRAISVLSDFLADFCLLGGIFVFADQSGMQYALPILTVHSYAWHLSMIFLGVYIIITGRHSGADTKGLSPASFLRNTLKNYAPDAALLLGLAAIAECINAVFHPLGSINMFYISPWEPVTQVVFCDIADRIGVIPEILLYLGCLLLGGFLFHLAGCLLPPRPKEENSSIP